MKGSNLIILLFIILVLTGGALVFLITRHNDSKVALSDHIQWTNLTNKTNRIHSGQVNYKIRCSSCHGMKGEGSKQAPNLSDNEWIYGNGSYDSIYSIIANGSPTGLMKGWKAKLFEKDLINLTLYVHQLRQPDGVK